jgi:hypothetical protein
MSEHRNGSADGREDFAQYDTDFGDVVELLAMGRPDPIDETPSDDVWNAIAAEIGGALVADEPADSPEEGADQGAEVVSLSARREAKGRRFAIVTGAVAAALLVGVPLVLAIGGGGPDRQAELAALGGFAGTGQAELNGRVLDIDVEGLDAPAGSFYELWLLDLDGDELQDLTSLGRIEADGSFTVPDGVDLDEFDVVDVSIELDDGNPDHSGDSILRGGLSDS